MRRPDPRGLLTTPSLILIALVLSSAPAALALQEVSVSTDFWDGVSDPSFCRVSESGSGFLDIGCTGTDASTRVVYPPPDRQRTEVTSSGSSVTMARAGAGSVGASVYNGYIVGFDNYYGYANASTSDDITVTGGTPGGIFTVAIGSIVNGGIGIYGSDAAASARAYFRLGANAGVSGSTTIFEDRAYGERNFDSDGNLLPPTHFYDYGVRNDYRFVDIQLDQTGSGSLSVELLLEVSAFEEGDENLYLSASAADYGDTVLAHLQPWSEDLPIQSATGWEIRPFGTPLEASPAPVSLTLEEIGIVVPEPAAALLLGLGLAVLSARRPGKAMQ